MEIEIKPHDGGWMVYLPNGDRAWQPSKQFAEAYARQYRVQREALEIELRKLPTTMKF